MKTGRIPNRGLEGNGTARILWDENREWLDKWIAKGHRFGLTTPEKELAPKLGDNPNGNFTYRELMYLRSRGIVVEDWSK